MVKGIFSNVNAQKLIQRGFKASSEGFLRKGVTEYSKILPKNGTKVSYYIENGRILNKVVRPGSSTYANRINNIEYTRFDGKRMMANFGAEHCLPALVLGDASTVKNAIQYNAQLRKEGYDLVNRINAIDIAFA